MLPIADPACSSTASVAALSRIGESERAAFRAGVDALAKLSAVRPSKRAAKPAIAVRIANLAHDRHVAARKSRQAIAISRSARIPRGLRSMSRP
jgi:hypothetical protein